MSLQTILQTSLKLILQSCRNTQIMLLGIQCSTISCTNIDRKCLIDIPLSSSIKREFRFHWTLYVDEGLVFLANYDGFNHQSILYNTYRKNAFRIGLNKEGKKGISPYLVVFFKSFNSDSKEAVFKIVTYGDVYVQ